MLIVREDPGERLLEWPVEYLSKNGHSRGKSVTLLARQLRWRAAGLPQRKNSHKQGYSLRKLLVVAPVTPEMYWLNRQLQTSAKG
jgi:hypothetical protein